MRLGAHAEELLLGSDLFRMVEAGARDAALQAARRIAVPAGGTLFRQGDLPERLFVVAEGRLRMSVVNEKGAAATLRFMQAGDVLGCAAALNQFNYPATATATVDSVVLAWSASEFQQLMRANAQLAINAAATVGVRVNDMIGRFRALLHEPLERRLARQLLRLQEQGRQAGAAAGAAIRISRQELAELTDASMFSISRIVSAWTRAGILDAARGRLTIEDARRLSQIAADEPAATPD